MTKHIFIFLATCFIALHMHAMEGERVTVIKEMLETCKKSDIQKAITLLDNGLDVNTVLQGADPFSDKEPVVSYTFHKSTFLHWAAKEGHMDLARLLVERGANKNARDMYGLSPILYAVRAGSPVFDLLLEQDADIHTPMSGNTFNCCYSERPIDYAVTCLQPEMVRKMIAHGGQTVTAQIDCLLFKHLGIRVTKIYDSGRKFGNEIPEYDSTETETRALDIIEILRRHGGINAVHKRNEKCRTGTIFHYVAQLNNRRYVCALIAPLAHESKRIFTFLCICNRLQIELPKEVMYRIFSYLPVDCTYSGLVEACVSKKERTAFRNHFLDDCFPQMPELVSAEEAVLIHQTLSNDRPTGQLACQLANDPEMKKILNPETWYKNVSKKNKPE